MDAETSKAMAAALRRAEMLDASGYLREDPRASDWRDVLAPMAKTDGLQPDKSPLSEVLNVAYALHELSADGFEEDVAWLETAHEVRAAEQAKKAAGAAEADEAAVVGDDAGGEGIAPPRRAAAGAGAAA